MELSYYKYFYLELNIINVIKLGRKRQRTHPRLPKKALLRKYLWVRYCSRDKSWDNGSREQAGPKSQGEQDQLESHYGGTRAEQAVQQSKGQVELKRK